MALYDETYKLVIVGDAGVGKTALLLKYFEDKFNAQSRATINFDYKTKIIIKGGVRVKLEIWDTAGQERFQSLSRTYIRGAHGILLVYDCTERDTFANVKNWMASLDEMSEPDVVPRILVGNKCDRAADKVIQRQTGQDLAERYKLQFFETSAFEGTNVKQAFESLVSKVQASPGKNKRRDLLAENAGVSRSGCC